MTVEQAYYCLDQLTLPEWAWGVSCGPERWDANVIKALDIPYWGSGVQFTPSGEPMDPQPLPRCSSCGSNTMHAPGCPQAPMQAAR